MARDPIPTWFFAVVVVRRGDTFLLVHERNHGQPWSLPSGRVEPGESFEDAARRETLEETGVPVRLTGVLRIEHSPGPTSTRMRVVYLAEPMGDTPPKQVPDAESLGAAWVRPDQLSQYALREEDVGELITGVAAGCPTVSLHFIQPEGSSYSAHGSTGASGFPA